MKFSTIIMAVGLAVFASAESTTDTAVAPVRTSSYTDAQTACLGSCSEADVNCRAECLGAPTPDAAAVDRTNSCVAACPQGDGSASDTQKYADCTQGCISSNFFTTTRVASQGGASTASPTSSGAESASTGPSGSPSGTDSNNSSASGSNTSPTGGASPSSNAAAGGLVAGGSIAGLFAMAAGVLVL